MKRHMFQQTGKVLKLVFISTVLMYIALLLMKTSLSEMRNQYFDLRSAALISIGFAVSFRTMLCCRKKV